MFCITKKNIFFLCMSKIVNITKEIYENNNIEVIIDEFDKLWLNEKHVGQQLGHKYLRVVTTKYNKEYRKCRNELINESTKQSHRRFIHNDLALKIIMNCGTDESFNLKKKKSRVYITRCD